MGTPAASILVVLALLVGVAALAGGEAPPPRHDPSAPVATIARRVEALRDLRFRRVPEPERVAAATARKEGLADLDRGYPPQRRRADETLYITLGLLPEGTDLRRVAGTLFGEQVAGYYDPIDGRLRIVEGAGTSNRVLDEMTIAHELTHALEDQALELDVDRADRSDDVGLAYKGLVEGTATQLMIDYADRHFEAGTALSGLLSGALVGTSPTTELPPFVTESITWPYFGGRAFVAELRRRGGWRLVDTAFQRPPESSEQVLHPEAWLLVDRPERVPAPAIPAGARRLTSGTFGEWQTGELVALAGGPDPEAARGWEGDRYVVWRDGSRSGVRIRWRYETAADARDLADALEGRGTVRRRGREVELTATRR